LITRANQRPAFRGHDRPCGNINRRRRATIDAWLASPDDLAL